MRQCKQGWGLNTEKNCPPLLFLAWWVAEYHEDWVHPVLESAILSNWHTGFVYSCKQFLQNAYASDGQHTSLWWPNFPILTVLLGAAFKQIKHNHESSSSLLTYLGHTEAREQLWRLYPGCCTFGFWDGISPGLELTTYARLAWPVSPRHLSGFASLALELQNDHKLVPTCQLFFLGGV